MLKALLKFLTGGGESESSAAGSCCADKACGCKAAPAIPAVSGIWRDLWTMWFGCSLIIPTK